MKLFLDIETTGLKPTEDKIVLIGVKGKYLKQFAGDEKELLEEFLEFYNKYKVKEIVGYGLGFDVAFLKIRCLKHNLKLPEFNNLVDIREELFGDTRLKGTFKELCKMLDIDRDEMTGEEIGVLGKYGQIDLVKERNKAELNALEKIYDRYKK